MNSDAAQTPGHREFLQRQELRIRNIREELDRAFPAPGPIVLEIGCGHGHYLVAYARQHPDQRCLGIDLVTRRIQLARRKQEKRQLANVHFLKAEVRELLAAWPERLRLARVFILFPDPWPKKRHAKNRIIQPALLDRLAELGDPGTALHFRTDDPANFSWCGEVIGAHPAWQIAAGEAWPFENPSYFQELFSGHQSLTALRR